MSGEGNGLPIQLEAKVAEYLSLVMQLIFAFGLVFEMPVVMTLLARAGLITAQGMRQKRKYAIVIAFIAAAILTPPDVISQIGLAVPAMLLYELSILAVGYVERRARAGRRGGGHRGGRLKPRRPGACAGGVDAVRWRP